MILCDSSYSNNNKKITLVFTKNMKNGVVMKLLIFAARFRRSKLEYLNDIFTLINFKTKRSISKLGTTD